MKIKSKKFRASAALPKTYNPKAVEDRMYAMWDRSGFFNPDNLPGKRTKPFTIMMPPPNATGTLHIGHAMFLTLEDLMTRFHRMAGRAALWLPGTDHAAIATNTKVEKLLAKEGKTKYDIGRAAFIERVKEYIAGSQGIIRKQIRRMGSSCDWSREAYTLDEVRSRAVREMFVRMYDDGLIYRGYRIVNWCPRCESTLADDEVEYREEKTPFYYFKYGPVVIGTARPETKFADKTVVVHPNDERYKHLIGKRFEVEWIEGKVQSNVIADQELDTEFGTGAMTITPAHDFHDFELAQKHGLPIVKIIDEKGNLTAAAGSFAGRNARESRADIVNALKKKGLVERVDENYTHNVSVCYRCETPIEPLTSRQWFVDVNKTVPRYKKSLKQLALDAVKNGKIEIIPGRFEKVYRHWMENLRDWCISRQIWFGHRIPVWYCQECYVEEGGGARASGVGKETRRHIGIVVSTEPPTMCPSCKRRKDLTAFTQDPDTLDTWFSSGTWTFSTLGWPEKTPDLKRFHPTDVLETGYDILFFWIARMILMTTYALGEVPFRKAYLHGLVRDEQGRKMSKSLENIIDPLDVAEKYGTDAVRLSLIISTSAGNDLRLSEEKIAYFRNFTNKLWNIARFVLLNTQTALAKPKTSLADKWILSRLDEVISKVTKDIESFNFSRAGETLRDFTWGELADWYLECAKIEGGKGEMLSHLLRTVLALWHPFMPFVTEEIYQKAFSTGKEDLLMVVSWPKNYYVIPATVRLRRTKAGIQKKTKTDTVFNLVRNVVIAIRNIRATYRVEPGKAINVAISAGGKAKLIASQAHLICGLAKVGKLSVEVKGKRPSRSAAAVVGGVQIFLPLAGLIDVSAERSRISVELADAEKYLATVEARLANDQFVKRAPSAVVAAEKEKRAAQRDKVMKFKEQLAALQ